MPIFTARIYGLRLQHEKMTLRTSNDELSSAPR
jgi:hypothetical protein